MQRAVEKVARPRRAREKRSCGGISRKLLLPEYRRKLAVTFGAGCGASGQVGGGWGQKFVTLPAKRFTTLVGKHSQRARILRIYSWHPFDFIHGSTTDSTAAPFTIEHSVACTIAVPKIEERQKKLELSCVFLITLAIKMDWRMGGLADWLMDGLVVWLTYELVVWLTDGLVVWLTGELVNWRTDWLTDYRNG